MKDIFKKSVSCKLYQARTKTRLVSPNLPNYGIDSLCSFGATILGEGIWGGIEKSGKTGLEMKSLLSTFACFSAAIAKVLSRSATRSYTKFAILDITFRFTCG